MWKYHLLKSEIMHKQIGDFNSMESNIEIDVQLSLLGTAYLKVYFNWFCVTTNNISPLNDNLMASSFSFSWLWTVFFRCFYFVDVFVLFFFHLILLPLIDLINRKKNPIEIWLHTYCVHLKYIYKSEIFNKSVSSVHMWSVDGFGFYFSQIKKIKESFWRISSC